MKRLWRYLLADPFSWMVYAFFQPRRLERELPTAKVRQRITIMLRMIVPMLLVAYPITVLGHIILLPFHLLLHPDIISILLESAGGIAGGIAFIICFLIGFFRVPFYLVSGPSTLKAYLNSRRDPTRVFEYLHRCSLYWDEIVYLPPYKYRFFGKKG